MKRLKKKQKLIIAIAIILIVVILAIVITTNIISNNSQIANEGYSATTTNANSNLVASYIKNGVKVGGITGTLEVLDTSDATATAEEIAWGKTAYVKGVKVTGTRIDTVAQAKEAQQAFSQNKILIDDYGNNVKVPAGFKIAADSATSVTGGVVIEDVSAPGKTSDTKGSQFVWIPVGDLITDTNGSTTTITLGRYTFGRDGTPTPVQTAENWSQEVAISTYFKELATSSYGNATAKNLEQFISKATISGGYYIGRYEAGDATAKTSQHSSSGTTNPVTCKTDVYPYNYVTQSQASSLAQEMYTSSNFDSDLINSYAWDTAIVFIQIFSGDTDYSRQTRLQSTLAKCGEATDGTNKDVRCNIYDMAGNTVEWTTESFSYMSNPCVNRGGYYYRSDVCTSSRSSNTTTGSSNNNSFRPTLYL